MKAGSVIVDLAADAGGNCELTEPGQRGHHAERRDHPGLAQLARPDRRWPRAASIPATC